MKTFICIASGPSLNHVDCLIARQSGFPVIAVNSSWEIAPWCHHIYAGDHHWWQKNHGVIKSEAERWCGTETTAIRYGCRHFKSPVTGSFNSGQRAILLAFFLGAERVLLLGYDCDVRGGTHWHRDHSDGLKNPTFADTSRWQHEFMKVRQMYGEQKVINCSRKTSLTAFTTANLEEQISLCAIS